MTPKRIPTRSGKPMFRYFLKTLIDKDDFDAIQPFITLARANLDLACECLRHYATCRSKKERQEILDSIPGHIEYVMNRGY